MKRFPLSLAAALIAAIVALGVAPAMSAGDPATAQLQLLIDGAQRSEKNRLRDRYRHPLETLAFFGLKDGLTVVEILPGSAGYWTEILAPYLAAHGTYYAAGPEKSTTSAEQQKEIAGFAAKLVAGISLNPRMKTLKNPAMTATVLIMSRT